MSRKSRQNAAERQKHVRFNAAIALALLVAVGAVGVLMLLRRPSLRPIDRADAIERRVTVESVQKSMLPSGRKKHPTQRGYLIDTAEAGRLFVDFGWQRIPGAESWPVGTELTVLLDPGDSDEVLAISRDGVDLIAFEDTAAQRAAAYSGTLRGAICCFAADAAGAAALAVWYRRKMKNARDKG